MLSARGRRLAARRAHLRGPRLTASCVGIIAEEAQQPDRRLIDHLGVHDEVSTPGMFLSRLQGFIDVTGIVRAVLIALPHDVGAALRLPPET